MIALGLTGGVGMGKSTAAAAFAELKAHVIDTDDLARQLVEPGQPALAEIRAAFGPEIIAADGRLDRQALARIVFGSEPSRRALEAILHPKIREHWTRQLAELQRQGTSVALVVIPLLYETSAESAFAHVITVACSPRLQLERIRLRGWSSEECRRRLDAQWPVSSKLERASFALWNDGSLASLKAQCVRVLASVNYSASP